jgi:hypothetical protein
MTNPQRAIPSSTETHEIQRVFNRVWDSINQINTVSTNNTTAIAKNTAGIVTLSSSASPGGGSIIPMITSHVELRTDSSNSVKIDEWGRCILYPYTIREVS